MVYDVEKPCWYALPTSFGKVTVVIGDNLIRGVWFEGQKHFMAHLNPAHLDECAPFAHCDAKLSQPPAKLTNAQLLTVTCNWLDSYFRGRRPALAPLLPYLGGVGTDFQKKVWAQLLKIPYGHVATYSQVAQAVGSAPRAVGAAIGRNPISIIVPCHRVVGAGGKLTGYAGGLELKQRLLDLETA